MGAEIVWYNVICFVFLFCVVVLLFVCWCWRYCFGCVCGCCNRILGGLVVWGVLLFLFCSMKIDLYLYGVLFYSCDVFV